MSSDSPHVFTINGRFLSQRVTGVQRYAHEIVARLDDILSNDEGNVHFRAKIVLPTRADATYRLSSIAIERTPLSGGLVWDQCVLPIYTKGDLLSLCNQGPLLASKQILCIHDLNTTLAPESYSRAFRLSYRIIQPLLARRAKWIVTVSQFSARMLVKHGFCAPAKIVIIPNGHEHVHRWDPSRSGLALRETQPRPYVFVLGSRAKHKNVEMLYSIAQELDMLGIDILVAGAAANLFSDLGSQPVPPNVRQLGFVSDDDLAALYKGALCFALPSLTEGFGVPALEAIALECPVVASDIPSLREVCGDAALYADPRSPGAWLNYIKRFSEHPEIAADMRKKGLIRATLFSWGKSARAYLDLLESVPTRP